MIIRPPLLNDVTHRLDAAGQTFTIHRGFAEYDSVDETTDVIQILMPKLPPGFLRRRVEIECRPKREGDGWICSVECWDKEIANGL